MFVSDKNPSPDAAQQFSTLTFAYEILSDSDLRDRYDRSGAETNENGRIKATKSEWNQSIWMNYIVFYSIWGALIYLLTIGKSSQQGRTWTLAALVLMALYEYQLLFYSSYS